MRAFFKRIVMAVDFWRRGVKAWGFLSGHTNIYLTARLGDNVSVGRFCEIGNYVTIGKNTRIGAFAYICEYVAIGEGAFIGPGVMFSNDMYPPSPKCNWQHTVVSDGAKIGAGAKVRPGIFIGKNAVIGMGAVVTRDIPDGEVWVGIPAKPLRGE